MADPIVHIAEEWRPCPGFEDLYAVSSLGRVKRSGFSCCGRYAPGSLIKGGRDTKGYPIVCLSRGGRRHTHKVHGLVARAFMGERNGRQVNHIDGNKTNNAVGNLEWATCRENFHHALRLGLIDLESHRGKMRETHRRNGKLSYEAVRQIRGDAAAGVSRKELASRFGIHVMTVGEIVREEIWRGV